jgi:ser/thr/tyr protein kinase RAD53
LGTLSVLFVLAPIPYQPILLLTLQRCSRARFIRSLDVHKQINGARVVRGQSRILRDGNEIAFGSPVQQQNAQEDYRYIYRHLAPFELTGIHAFYDMAHELGRGTFATVMKAMSRTTGEWWAVKIIHAQKLRAANTAAAANNNNNNNNNAVRNNTGQLQNLAREISILETLDHPNICRLRETFVPEDGGHDFCELYLQ